MTRVPTLVAVSVVVWTSPLFAQQDQEITNLRAFTTLFGYVRYFHPSDHAATIPWDGFAEYGARRVRDAGDETELHEVLEELFQAIAPSVQIWSSSETPPAPIVQARSDTAGLSVVAWQHLGVRLGGGNVYQSIRVNRDNLTATSSSPFGNVMQSVDASPHRGRPIRLRAFVRTEVSGSGNQGQLWLRVDRPEQGRGFFDNMGDRPITDGDWREYVIEGVVADDATRIVFGAFLLGAGVLRVDDFELSVQHDDGEWTAIAAANLGFEEASEQPIGWTARTPGYRYRVGSEGAHGGSGSLTVQGGDYVRGQIFDAMPEVGETVTKPIGGGLTARIPIALYGDSARTLEPTVGVESDTLRTALDALRRDPASADDASVRLAAVIVAWNVFQHFYPYFDVVGTDWDAELTNALSGALSDQTPEDFHDTLSRLVAALHDGHGRVFHPTITPNAELPMRLSWIENELVIMEAVDTSMFRRGDVIRSIDGDEVQARLPAVEALISGSPQWKRYRAAREIGVGAAGSEAGLRVTRGETTFEATVLRVQQPAIPGSDEPSVRQLEPSIWYVNLDLAEMTEISENINAIASAEGVVFDLRGYPNGNHEVLSHLLAEPDTSVRWMRVQQAIYPDRERIAGWGEYGWNIQPIAPHIQGRVVFLTDGSAISYAESFMSFVEHYRLAEIVGAPTAGANGNVNPFTLPGGFRVRWTGMRVLKHDGSQHHNVGIQPTVPLEPTIEGIRANRDELLEKALEIIKAQPIP